MSYTCIYAGTEFQAVFLSTTEPVDSVGNTTNPTKSPCDPYVFNTALTRSKSLVVAVGSPVALLRIEEHMVKKYGRKAQCWSSYMKLCLEKGTFIIPSEIEPSERIRKDFKSVLISELSVSDAKEVATKLTAVTNVSSASEQDIAGDHSNANAATSYASAVLTQPMLPRNGSLGKGRKSRKKSRNRNLPSMETSPINTPPVPSNDMALADSSSLGKSKKSRKKSRKSKNQNLPGMKTSPPVPSKDIALADSSSLGSRNQNGMSGHQGMKTTLNPAPASPASPVDTTFSSSQDHRRHVESSERSPGKNIS